MGLFVTGRGDLTISIAECSANYERYLRSLALPATQGPAWFRAMDCNNDGDVSQREFTGPPDVFTNLDTDKDGLLSADEAAKVPAKK